MIRAPVGRYIRYWYTYRTAVAVVIAVLLSGVMYWLYTQQAACDTHSGCVINISVHPEDRLIALSNPDPNVVIVGVDNASGDTIGVYPVPRERSAQVPQSLEAAGPAVDGYEVGFPDPREPKTVDPFAGALPGRTDPV